MPYAVKLYAYLFVANVLDFVIVARWIGYGFWIGRLTVESRPDRRLSFLERSRLRISNQVPIPEPISGEYLPPSMKAIIETRINSAPATATLE
jgi:hypothetical protein